MTVIQYLSTFRLFSAEVLLLALGVSVLTSVLKKTCLKHAKTKVYVLLPFALGIVLYAIFKLVVTQSILPLTEEIFTTLEGGFACGCAATLYYVIWEQFFRGESFSPLYPLLKGFVEEEKRAEIAEELYLNALPLQDDAMYAYLKETLKKYFLQSVTPAEREALVLLIKEFLVKLQSE